MNAARTAAFATVATTAPPCDRLTSRRCRLQTLARGIGVSVADAATSLSVSWAPPLDDNGYEVTGYEVRWWRGEGVDEVEIVEINAVAHNVSGTFKLTYDGGDDGVELVLKLKRAVYVFIAVEPSPCSWWTNASCAVSTPSSTWGLRGDNPACGGAVRRPRRAAGARGARVTAPRCGVAPGTSIPGDGRIPGCFL